MKYLVICAFVVSALASCSSAPATVVSAADSIAVDSLVCDSADTLVSVPDSILVDSVK